VSVAVQDSAVTVLAEVFGQNVEWSPVALSQGEWPEEALDGAVSGFREASFRGADYLAGVRGAWEAGPREAKFSLWRMKKDETDWLFLGHFDKWPDEWTKAGF
jgi:hypothetical protein